MSEEKASFYSRDPSTPTSNAVEDSTRQKKYMGEERRRNDRRKAKDRREDVRFDLKKTDRREVEGRRQGDNTPKFW